MGNEQRFSVGEMVLLVTRPPQSNPEWHGHRYHGCEAQVIRIGGDIFAAMLGNNNEAIYRVRVEDGTEFQCFAHNLRKKRPPPQREQTTTWDDVIVWRPKTENVT